MGIISEALCDRIKAQIARYGIVVWFDPEERYTAFFQHLVEQQTLPDTTIERLDGSYFALRYQVDHLLDGDAPPHLLIYLTISEADTHQALAELTSLGTVMSPTTIEGNTDLRSLVGEVLHQRQFPPEVIAQLQAQIKTPVATGLSLDELDHQIAQITVPYVTLLNSIYDSNEPLTILLRFLTDPTKDATLQKRAGWSQLTTLCAERLGMPDLVPSISQGRDQVAQWILQTDLLATLHDPPPQLQAITAATEATHRMTCVAVANDWRRIAPESYNAQAERVAGLLHLANYPLTVAQARDCYTFADIDGALQTALETTIADQPADLDFVTQRQRGYWARQSNADDDRYNMIAERWSIISLAGQLCELAQQVESAASRSNRPPAQFVTEYTAQDAPWCLLEERQRTLEGKVQGARHAETAATTQTLITIARQRYQRAAERLATAFTHALHDADFQIPGILRQRDIFATQVQPALRRGRVAYLLIDALRYEMARQMLGHLRDGFTVTALEPAIGTPPTITPIGMAALLPGAEQQVELVAKRGTVGLKLGDTSLFDRKSRLTWLKAQRLTNAADAPAKIADIHLAELREHHGTPTWTKADLLIVTSQDIDEGGETDRAAFRPVMDDTLRTVEDACHSLRGLKFDIIIITADHGHLYGAALGDDMAIDPPGGEEVDLHRRAWVGRGGTQNADVLRVPLERFGIAGGYDLAVPWGLGVFRAPGGNRAYMHGGLSLPELVIPVAQIAVATPVTSTHADWEWSMQVKRPAITSRIFTVVVQGKARTLLNTPPPTMILELRAGDEAIGFPQNPEDGSPLANFTPSVRPELPLEVTENHIIQIDVERPPVGEITLRLFDASTRRELANLPLTWAIAI
ncbi:MAG: PglZ domain-containing protein [Ktedonobacterales bacterium]|nr:PglZ domain-containing protein [Ktedonobacterales bacterium]